MNMLYALCRKSLLSFHFLLNFLWFTTVIRKLRLMRKSRCKVQGLLSPTSVLSHHLELTTSTYNHLSCFKAFQPWPSQLHLNTAKKVCLSSGWWAIFPVTMLAQHDFSLLLTSSVSTNLCEFCF